MSLASTSSFTPIALGHRRPGGGFGLLAVGLPPNRLFAALAARRDRRHLHALSDHMLKDIGLRRDQIEDALKGAVPRP